MKISLLSEHLFYKYFVSHSVGQATNGRNVKTKTWFSRLLFKIEVWFFICKNLSNKCASIVWIICPSFCLLGYKRQNVKIHDFLVWLGTLKSIRSSWKRRSRVSSGFFTVAFILLLALAGGSYLLLYLYIYNIYLFFYKCCCQHSKFPLKSLIWRSH